MALLPLKAIVNAHCIVAVTNYIDTRFTWFKLLHLFGLHDSSSTMRWPDLSACDWTTRVCTFAQKLKFYKTCRSVGGCFKNKILNWIHQLDASNEIMKPWLVSKHGSPNWICPKIYVKEFSDFCFLPQLLSTSNWLISPLNDVLHSCHVQVALDVKLKNQHKQVKLFVLKKNVRHATNTHMLCLMSGCLFKELSFPFRCQFENYYYSLCQWDSNKNFRKKLSKKFHII